MAELFTLPHLIILVVSIYSIVLHEAAHAFAANYFGDPTPRIHGRLTLNPWPHIEHTWMATLALPVLIWYMSGGRFAFGGGACPVSRQHLRRHRWGEFWVSFAGPAVNLTLAIVFSLVYLMVGDPNSRLGALLLEVSYYLVLAELLIGLFNLLPIPPMDGAYVIADIYRPLRTHMDRLAAQPWGMALPFLIGWPIIDRFIAPAINDYYLAWLEALRQSIWLPT
jgi:Zn-dependent protease